MEIKWDGRGMVREGVIKEEEEGYVNNWRFEGDITRGGKRKKGSERLLKRSENVRRKSLERKRR